jgi:hypothetical protein
LTISNIKHMKRVIFTFVVLVMLSACKKGDNNDLPQEVEEVPNVTVSVAKIKETQDNGVVQSDPKYNLLGFGYDITNKYANIGAVRAKVIDVPLFVANNDNEAFSFGSGTQGFSIVLNATSAEDLSGQLSDLYYASKGLHVFKSTITSAFPETDAEAKKFVYGYYSAIFQGKRLRIEGIKGSNSLTASFTTDLNSLNPEQLVKKYGTHIMQRIHVGARINVIYQSEVSDDQNKRSAVREGLDYSIKKIFGFSPSLGNPVDVRALNSNSAVKLRYEVIGGDTRNIKEVDVAGNRMVDINDWSRNFSEETYKFIDFDNNGLIPLSDLVLDGRKKSILQEFIKNYIQENQVKTNQ